MKKISLVIALFIAIGAFAQKRGCQGGHERGDAFTPEQKTQLMVMKLSIALDLSKKQENEITPIVAKKVNKMLEMKDHKKGDKGKGERKELSSDEKFAMAMKHVEEKKALQEKMKNILDKDQYAQWKKMQKKHMNKKQKGENGKGKRKGGDERRGDC